MLYYGIISAAMYLFWIGLYFTYERVKIKKENSKKDTRVFVKKDYENENIIGKSKFKMSSPVPANSISKPIVTPEKEIENPILNTDTFVQADVQRQPKQIPVDELEEAFREFPPEGEENNPMEEDYTLEEEPKKEEFEEDPEEERVDLQGTTPLKSATGISFEELDTAMRTAMANEEVSTKERKEAGRVFFELQDTDLFNQLIANPNRADAVGELINLHLGKYNQLQDAKSGNRKDLKWDAPADFDINSIV